MAKKEGTWRAYFDCVMLKIQNSIHNIFAITEVTKDQKTDPHSTTISFKKVTQFTKFRGERWKE